MDFFEKYPLIEVLENSNFNGLGWAVTSVLFYLSLYHFVLFLKSKEKFYLFYSLYALINAINLIQRVKGVFTESLYTEFYELFIHLNFPIQFASYLIFSFFLIEILNFRKHYPKFTSFFTYYAVVTSSIFGVLVLGRYVWDGYDMMRGYYITVFMPCTLVLLIYGVYLTVKTGEKVRFFILAGFLILGIATFIFAFLTFGKDASITNKYQYIYYLAVLAENYLYTYALAIKQREVYEEKFVIKTELVTKLQENEDLRDALNQNLQNELKLKESQISFLEADAAEQRVVKLSLDYEKQITLLHLQSLRSQMNPHFIFNALNSIKVFLIESDKENAVLYLNKFAKLIRMVLESSREFKISLGEELDIAKLYLSLEAIRFEDGIDFSIDVERGVSLRDIKVPPLVFQPFLENAVWHGLMRKKGVKSILIKVSTDEEGVVVSIQDNGIGRAEAMKMKANQTIQKQSIGISLSSDRLKFFNQSEKLNYFFEIIDLDENPAQRGTEVRFHLKK
ncbi:histidine kinase [Algoriphagus aquimarinus]|uniref:7TM diverse intracellular signalling n=1 Tax=Algoriphagus aquimarinus TaxID=237018 RepID=A0A1I1C6V2_9BACT|nr:histidine kinase [Algoriphagus aquimarinus]SFB56490.1 7TM diverse intracellular signalling [Algoriphagus aquimarinus]